MPSIDLVVKSDVQRTPRVRQLEAMFDVPPQQKMQLSWKGELPLEEFGDWNVGLIVGPSGSGKTQIATKLFGAPRSLKWGARTVVDDFASKLSMQEIAAVCQAVGFNTIPAWMRSFKVLSNGEQFRVALARHLLEDTDPIVVDEFTSVVDRQIAKIGSHAVQKYCRKNNRKFIAVSCHYDIIEWLQPDWTFEPATMEFVDRRSLRGKRPELTCTVSRVNYEAWQLFAPFHYLTAELNKAARCFGLFIDGRITSFTGILHRPHPTSKNIVGVSRIVTLPDWQGLGLAFVLLDSVASAYKASGKRFRNYPAHPAFIRAHMHSTNWQQVKKGGTYSPRRGSTSSVAGFGGRPCAVFEYVGPANDAAVQLVSE